MTWALLLSHNQTCWRCRSDLGAAAPWAVGEQRTKRRGAAPSLSLSLSGALRWRWHEAPLWPRSHYNSLGASRGLRFFSLDINYLSHASRFQMSGNSSRWQFEPWRSLQPHFSKLSRYRRIIRRGFVLFFSCGRKIHHEFAVAQCCCGAQTQALRISFTGSEAPPRHWGFYWHCCTFSVRSVSIEQGALWSPPVHCKRSHVPDLIS